MSLRDEDRILHGLHFSRESLEDEFAVTQRLQNHHAEPPRVIYEI